MRNEGGQIESGHRGSWIPARAWLLFNTWFSSLIVCVSVVATLHLPINRAAAWSTVILCSGFAGALAIRLNRSTRHRNSRLPGLAITLLILGAVVLVLWGSLMKGEFVSVYPDPWSYSAFATYLQKQGPVIGQGPHLVLAYGSALMGTRYGTPGLLALFAEISRTDACRSASIYAFLVLTHLGLGFILLARALGAKPSSSIGAGLFGVTIGWAPEILKIGNWDQILFISLIPFALCRIRLLTFSTARISGILGLGVCLAATIFVYPEGAALAGIIYLPLVIWRVLRGAFPLEKIRRLAFACGVAILLSLVYLPTFVSFLSHQVFAGNTLRIAQGGLGGLLSPNWLPAIYCLGAQLPYISLPKLDWIVGFIFFGLSFVAVGTWWRKRDGILLTLPFFLALSLWQAFLVRYDYGLYKVLTMFWPVMVAAIFGGISQVLSRLRGLARRFVLVAFCGLMLGAVIDEVESFRYSPWHQERRIAPFVELAKLKEISGDAPILIRTQSWFNQMWAVFFLQGYTLAIPNPLLNLRDPATGLRDGASEELTGNVVLTDEKKRAAIWHNEVFSLLNHSEPVEVVAIDAPNTVERVEGDQFIWLDNRFADLTIQSDAERRAFLLIPECRPGPNRPDDSNRTLILEVNGETVEVPAQGSLKIPLALKKGKNLVRLACKERPTTDKLGSGDPRTLLLGLKGFSVSASE